MRRTERYMGNLGKILLVTGIFIAAAGLLLMVGDRIPYLGRLPGDLRWTGEDWSFYFPLTTCLLLSAVLTLLLNLVLRFLGSR